MFYGDELESKLLGTWVLKQGKKPSYLYTFNQGGTITSKSYYKDNWVDISGIHTWKVENDVLEVEYLYTYSDGTEEHNISKYNMISLSDDVMAACQNNYVYLFYIKDGSELAEVYYNKIIE